MKKMLVFSALFILFLSTASVNAELVVIVNKANASSIDAKAAQRIFLGKEKKFSNGGVANPINLPSGHALRSDFDEQVLGRSSSQVAAYWSKLVFTGKGVPPTELNNPSEVRTAVESDANAIAYIDIADAGDSVTIVKLK
jgi:ABC-type phosphate transport system substrate-binding protein